MSEYPICNFPLCKRHPQKNGYCISHQIYAGTPAPKKEKAPIPKRSEKMTDSMKEYKKKAKAFLSRPENLKCKAELPGCKGLAEVVHHVRGRTGKSLLDESEWMAVCSTCNITAESQDGLARKKGVKKSRIVKVEK